MYGVAKPQSTVIVPAGNGPGPQPGPTPTRRAAILAEKATAEYATGDPAKQDRVKRAIKAAEDVLSK